MQYPTHFSRFVFGSLFVLSLLNAACGGDDGPGSAIDPSDITAAHLEGYWTAAGVDSIGSPVVTTFGFTNAARAQLVLGLEQNEIVAPEGAPISVAYISSPYSLISDNQYATYAVEGGELLQTVLADVASPPGTQYSTSILSLTAQESMSLESSMSATGERTYTWHARCPAPNMAGWNRYVGYVNGCPPAIALGNSLAFDAHGDVHAVHGIGAAAYCEQPTYAYITEACVPKHYVLPYFTASAIDVSEDIVRLALALGDGKLVVYTRALSEPDFGDAEIIDAAPGTIHSLRFVEGAQTPTLHWDGTATGLEVVAHSYTLETNGSWTKRTGDQMLYPLGSTIAPNGDAYYVQDRALYRVTQAGEPVGASVALPATESFLGSSPPHVTADGRVQVVIETRVLGENPGGSGGRVIGNEAYLLEWNGTEWTETLLGNQYGAWIVTGNDGPTRVVVAAQKASTPELVMHTIENSVIVDSELVHEDGPLGALLSPESFHVPTAIVNADGDIATTFDGKMIYVRRGETLDRRPTTVAVHFNGGDGNTRFYSDDGRFDCMTDCAIEAKVGENILFHVDPAPGYQAFIDCPSGLTYGASSCRVPIRGATQGITINLIRSALERELVVGIPSSMSVATMFDAEGDKLVLQAEFNPGVLDYQVGSVMMSLDNAAPRAIVAYDRGTEDAWMTPIPTAPLGLAAPSDGGAWVVTAITGTETFGSMTVGTSSNTSLVRVRYDASGEVADASVITTGTTATFSVTMAAIDADGNAVALTRSNTDWIFVRAGATGTPTNTTLTTLPFGVSAREISIDGAKALLRFDTTLVVMNDASVVNTRTLTGADFSDAAILGARVVALVGASTSVDLGGATCTAGSTCVVQYDDALAYDAHAVPTGFGTGSLSAIAAVDDGVIVALGNQVSKYDADLELVVPPVDFTLGMVFTTGQDDDSLMLLQIGTLVELKPE